MPALLVCHPAAIRPGSRRRVVNTCLVALVLVPTSVAWRPRVSRAQGVTVELVCLGPGNQPRARRGDTITCSVRVRNDILRPEFVRMDSVVFTIGHTGNPVTTPNMLTPPVQLPPGASTIVTIQAQVADTDIGLIVVDVTTAGINVVTEEAVGGSASDAIHLVCDDDRGCDDRNACNGIETCRAGECVAGSAPTCADDHDPCTLDECRPDFGCHAPTPCCGNHVVEPDVGEECEPDRTSGDGRPCCDDTCRFRSSDVVCRPKAPGDDCDAPESCSGDAAACPDDARAADGTPCNDGNICTPVDTCQAGSCTSGEAVCAVDIRAATAPRRPRRRIEVSCSAQPDATAGRGYCTATGYIEPPATPAEASCPLAGALQATRTVRRRLDRLGYRTFPLPLNHAGRNRLRTSPTRSLSVTVCATLHVPAGRDVPERTTVSIDASP
jgi:hypothetical protein